MFKQFEHLWYALQVVLVLVLLATVVVLLLQEAKGGVCTTVLVLRPAEVYAQYLLPASIVWLRLGCRLSFLMHINNKEEQIGCALLLETTRSQHHQLTAPGGPAPALLLYQPRHYCLPLLLPLVFD